MFPRFVVLIVLVPVLALGCQRQTEPKVVARGEPDLPPAPKVKTPEPPPTPEKIKTPEPLPIPEEVRTPEMLPIPKEVSAEPKPTPEPTKPKVSRGRPIPLPEGGVKPAETKPKVTRGRPIPVPEGGVKPAETKPVIRKPVDLRPAFVKPAEALGGVRAPDPPPMPVQEPRNPAVANEKGWREFKSAEGTFKVMLPGKPEVKQMKLKTDNGTFERTTTLASGDGLKVQVHEADHSTPALRGISPIQYLQIERAAILEETGGRMTNERLRELPGRTELQLEDEITLPDGNTMTVVWMPSPRRSFTLQISGTEGSPTRDQIRRCIDSFRLGR